MDNNSLPKGFKVDAPAPSSPAGGDSSLPAGFDLDENKFGGAGGELKAAAAGAARTATFGLSDQALTKSGLVNPQTLKGLEQTNPISTHIGEGAGVIIPALIGDEVGVLGEGANLVKGVSNVGSAVEKGVGSILPEATTKIGNILTGATKSAAGLATEGAAYGLGNSISEDALGDHDLVSEHTLANMGMAAAFAGGIGALFGAGINGFAKDLTKDAATGAEKLAIIKAGNSAIPESTENLVAGAQMPTEEKSKFFSALTKQKDNADEIKAAGELIGAPVLPGQTSASKFIQDSTSSMSKSPTIVGVKTQQEIQKGYDAIQNVVKDTLGSSEHLSPFEAGSRIKEQISDEVDKIYAPIKEAYANREAIGKTIELADDARIKMYDSLVEESQNYGSVGSKGSGLIRDYAERALAQNNVSQLDKLISEIGGDQRIAYRAGDTESAKAMGLVTDTLKDFQIKQIAKQGRALEAEGAEHAEAITNDIIREHKETQAKYRDFKETLNDLASDGRLGRKLNTHGTVETVLDSIPNEKVVDKMFDPKNSAGLARLQEKFPEVFKTLVDQKKSAIFQKSLEDGSIKVNKVLGEIDKLSPEMKKLMFAPDELNKLNASKTWLEALPKDINPSGTAKGIAFNELLHNPIATAVHNLSDFAIKRLMQFASPAEAEKIGTLVTAQRNTIKATNKIEDGISDILDKPGKFLKPIVGALSSRITSVDDYNEKTKKISEIANNPTAFHDQISTNTQPLYNHAPGLTASMQKNMSVAASFLNSKIPQSPAFGVFAKKQDPSNEEIAKFNRYYSVAEDPTSVLKQIKSNTLTNEALETLQTVYPKLYGQMKHMMLEKITAMADPSSLPYKTKAVLTQFLGEPIDPSMTPQAIASNQSVYAQNPQQQNLKQPKSSQTGMGKIDLASRTRIHQPEENV